MCTQISKWDSRNVYNCSFIDVECWHIGRCCCIPQVVIRFCLLPYVIYSYIFLYWSVMCFNVILQASWMNTFIRLRYCLSLPSNHQSFKWHMGAITHLTVKLFSIAVIHDDIIKWKHLPHYWPFVRGQRWISPTKASDAERSLICAWKTVEQTTETPVIWDYIALIMTSLWCITLPGMPCFPGFFTPVLEMFFF